MQQSQRISLRLALAATVLVLQPFLRQAVAEPVVKEALHEIDVIIEAIDLSTRTLSVRGPDGVTSIQVSPEVRNLDRLRVGGKVHVKYYEAIAAELKKKGTAASKEVREVATMYRAPAGSRPAGAVGRAVTATVKIESIDLKQDTVTFSRSGKRVTVGVQSPEGARFIRTLVPGDEVEIAYVEALAVEAAPAD